MRPGDNLGATWGHPGNSLGKPVQPDACAPLDLVRSAHAPCGMGTSKLRSSSLLSSV